MRNKHAMAPKTITFRSYYMISISTRKTIDKQWIVVIAWDRQNWSLFIGKLRALTSMRKQTRGLFTRFLGW